MSVNADLSFGSSDFSLQLQYGFIHRYQGRPGPEVPDVVLNDGEDTTVLRTLRAELKHCEEFFFSVAFVTPGAIAMLKQDLLNFRGQGTIVTGNYLNFNSPSVFQDLLHLSALGIRVDVRIHDSRAFHPKGYIFRRGDRVTSMIGSANLTETALTRNYEWNVKVTSATESHLANQLARIQQRQWDASGPLTQTWIDDYARVFAEKPPMVWRGPTYEVPQPPVEEALADQSMSAGPIVPNDMQAAALRGIESLRRDGEKRAVVISATGTGKTILAALDVRAYAPRRMLFLVHREQIIDRAITEFRQVLGGQENQYGKFVGGHKDRTAKYLFASVQSLARPENLASFKPHEFDYVLIDEVHRAGAESYQRVMDHLHPEFLLGVTATPERTDGFSIFELFDYNVAYEIRLKDALDAQMLVPFHYYGVPAHGPDGAPINENSTLRTLVDDSRVDHIVTSIDKYSQQGVKTRGLMFCSAKAEAQRLAEKLNQRVLNGQPLRTVALTGEDSHAARVEAVAKLDAGELDYLLTVDIFNEGIDIPQVNQVVMLRQTASAIVFVQQLGRGLRKAPGKSHLTVIDFIGNYQNNFMIPIALFGDQSLNKESIRKNLVSAEEDGVIPGLSSVHFDEIARERVLHSIDSAKLDDLRELKRSLDAMQQRLGKTPRLRDFWEQNSIDPLVLATKMEHLPALIEKTLKKRTDLSDAQSRMLHLLSHEVLPAKRLHEFVVIKRLLASGTASHTELQDAFRSSGLPPNDRLLVSAIDTLALRGYNALETKRYGVPIIEDPGTGMVRLSESFTNSYQKSGVFREEVDDVLWTGTRRNVEYYAQDRIFTPGRQYSRRDASRLLGWNRSTASTIYGYKVDRPTRTCAIFVTLHKGEDVQASVAYEDELLDPHTLRWFTRSRRTLKSKEVADILSGNVSLDVFVQRDGAQGTEFYHLGKAQAGSPVQTTMKDAAGVPLDVVQMMLHFDEPIEHSLYDYFHPMLTS